MKKLLLMACILLSTACMAHKNPDLKTNLVVKGRVTSGELELTRLVVINSFDTLVDKLVKKRYKLSLKTNESYEVVFTNGAEVKYMVVDSAPKNGYYVKIDVDWTLDPGTIAFLLYNTKMSDYSISITEAAR